LLRRSPLERRAPLRSRRSKPMLHHRATPRDRGELEDTRYIAWLWTRPCRVPGCRRPSEPHHLRHDANGAGLGARLKDDRRAISLCCDHHRCYLHDNPWRLREILGVDDLKAWQDEQLAIQRSEYEAQAKTSEIEL